MPLLLPMRYKGIYGGRGSAKSHFFAESLVEHHLIYPGLRSVCIREVQGSLSESSQILVNDKIKKHGLEGFGFRVLKDRIETPGDGVIIFKGMQDYNADSIKSLEGFGIAWVEEANRLSSRSLQLLRPTLRDSKTPGFKPELWFSWNPDLKTDAVDLFFRGPQGKPDKSILVKANHSDNPWMPPVLESERLEDLEKRPDSYDHIWEGGYRTVVEGAYWAKNLIKARAENRIGFVPRDPLMHCYAFLDIGGTGNKSDAMAIWVVQFIGQAINIIAHYQAQGQELSDHVFWLQENNFTVETTKIYLPHDGTTHERINRITFESEFKRYGYKVVVRTNDGKGAALQRVAAVRSVFHRFWIDEIGCADGLLAIGWYHEKKSKLKMGLGPEHDWSSHSADALGLMALEVEKITKFKPKSKPKRPTRPKPSGWMGQ